MIQILKDNAVKVLHSVCQQIWKTGLEMVSFHSNSNEKECSNCHTIALMSHASKIMLKILQARLQRYMNREIPTGFRKGRGTRDQIANIHWLIKKAREFHKTSISALLTMSKPLAMWITINLWKILQEMGIPDHMTCLLRNLYTGQEATV